MALKGQATEYEGSLDLRPLVIRPTTPDLNSFLRRPKKMDGCVSSLVDPSFGMGWKG